MRKLFLMGRSEAGKTSLTQALKGGDFITKKPSIQSQMRIPLTPRENMRSPRDLA